MVWLLVIPLIRQKLAWLTLFLRNWLTVKQPLLPCCKEDNEAVIDAYFTKYDTQIMRWDVATVVAEIEAALQVQEDLYNQARAQMKAERKAERKDKLEEFKANVKAKFDKLKA